MSGKQSSKASSSSSSKKRKKQRRSVTDETQAKTKAKVQGTLVGFSKRNTKDIVDLESLNHLHTGKRLLLSADSLYDDEPPEGEENYMFLYTVQKIYAASNNKTKAVLDFQNRAIENGGDEFFSYADVEAEEKNIDSELTGYDILSLDDDHQEYLRHLGRVNKKINDKKDKEKLKKQRSKASEVDDVEGLIQKFDEDVSGKFMCDQFHRPLI